MAVNLKLNRKDVAAALVQYGMAQRGNYITDQEQQSKQIDAVLKVYFFYHTNLNKQVL